MVVLKAVKKRTRLRIVTKKMASAKAALIGVKAQKPPRCPKNCAADCRKAAAFVKIIKDKKLNKGDLAKIAEWLKNF